VTLPSCFLEGDSELSCDWSIKDSFFIIKKLIKLIN
jgi:hypothetical protein